MDSSRELYDVTKDFSEANDLATKEPRKLRELQELFWIEAAKNNVLPLDNSKIERMYVAWPRRVHLLSGNDAHTRRQRAAQPWVATACAGTSSDRSSRESSVTRFGEKPAPGDVLAREGDRRTLG